MTEIAFNSQTAFADYMTFKKSLAIDPSITGEQLETILMAFQMVACMRLQAVGVDAADFMAKTVEDITAAE